MLKILNESTQGGSFSLVMYTNHLTVLLKECLLVKGELSGI